MIIRQNCFILQNMTNKSNNVLYWTCQLIGWGFYFGFLTASLLMFSNSEAIVMHLQIIITATLICTSHGLRTFFKRKAWTNKPVKWVLPRLLLVLAIAALLSQVIIHALMVLVINWQEYRPIDAIEFFIYAGNVFIIFFVWSLLYFSYHYWQNNRRKELENWQLKAQLNEAELTILKSQINPHFLFNALNNIRSLILSEPEKARDMITHISELMRYFIQFNSNEKVSVDQEIEVVKDYLALEKIQYDERLTYQIEIDELVKSHKIPPMSIQLLVENAIKHGISQLPDGGNILVSVKGTDDQVAIKVINSGQLIDKETESGIGLKNLTDRINILFGAHADIEVKNQTENTVSASIKIPV